MSLMKTIKEWMLPIAMLTGASVYLIYHFMPGPVHCLGPLLSGIVGLMQPLLIFLMLFFTFCGIEPRDLKPHRWHWWLLLIQGGVFVATGLLAWALRGVIPSDSFVLMECVMLCFSNSFVVFQNFLIRKKVKKCLIFKNCMKFQK